MGNDPSFFKVMIVTKSKLKARMLEFFREVERSGETLVVTDHGREVLEIRPIQRCSTIQEVLAEYPTGPGMGCGEISTDEILPAVPANE